ncbi:MAG: hypothetical protein ACSHWS_13190 [Sulfitobacter sp.]
MPRWIIVLVFAMIASNSAADPFSDALLKQLECSQPPSPVTIFSVLADAGLIDPESNIGVDSLSCFEMTKPINLAGLPVISVCGFEEDKQLRDQRADLFYRAPGTSPGQTLSIGTRVSMDEAAKWYTQTIGTTHLRSALSDEYSAVEGTVEISCTSWFAR